MKFCFELQHGTALQTAILPRSPRLLPVDQLRLRCLSRHHLPPSVHNPSLSCESSAQAYVCLSSSLPVALSTCSLPIVAMFRSVRAMDAALTKARSKAKRTHVRTATALDHSKQSVKHKADPGVPNLTKVKQALNRRAEREQAKEDRRNRHSHTRTNPTSAAGSTASTLHTASTAAREEEKIDTDDTFTSAPSDSAIATARHYYYRELKQVIADSDIVLEVLDARDPLGCRHPHIEQLVVSSLQADQQQAKRLVLVLNKIDLVSKEAMDGWMRYLKRFYPVVAFKSSTQQQSAHLNRHEPSVSSLTSASTATVELTRSGCVGASQLIQLLKNYSRSLNMKRNITVGIIGLPNVGKSSLINSLKRSRAVAVGNKPGMTKVLQQVRLDAQVTLIDSPGVIPPESVRSEEESQRMLLRNCLNVDKLSDPLAAATALVRYVDLGSLLRVYGLDDEVKADEVLVAVARKQGKLLAGGVANVDAVARIMLHDLNAGKIRYERTVDECVGERAISGSGVGGGVSGVVESEVVSEWAKEFDVDELLRGDVDVRVEREGDQSGTADDDMQEAVDEEEAEHVMADDSQR